MSWFFVEPRAIRGGYVTLDPVDSHHLLQVLRARPGAEFTAVLSDPAPIAYRCRLVGSKAGVAAGRVLGSDRIHSEPPVHVTVFQGLPKGDKFDYVTQKVTELGAAVLVPVACERSVVQLSPAKAADRVRRWQRIARETAQQGFRGRVPAVEPVIPWTEAAGQAGNFDLALVAWEEHAGRPGLADRLAAFKQWPERTLLPRVAVYVGPEGGLTGDETALAVAAGGVLIGLGPRILRTETAALVALAAIMFAIGDLG